MYLEGEITLQVYIKKIVEILFIKTEKKKKKADESSEEELFPEEDDNYDSDDT